MQNVLLPIRTVADYADIKTDAKVQICAHPCKIRTADTKSNRKIYVDNLPVQDLVFEILGAAQLQRMDSAGNLIADGDAGGTDADFATMSESAKCINESIHVRLNTQDLLKDSEMQMWFKYVDSIRKDRNEEESLAFYRHLDETAAGGGQIVGTPAITKATMATEDELSLKELYEEAVC